MMRFDNPGKVEEVVYSMRLADLPRGDNRALLNRLYNGDAPFDEDLAEQNQIEINRNDLEGVNLLSQARRQWTQAFLPSGNYFNVALDCGAPHKRREYSHAITRNANRVLKRSRRYMEQARATGANVLLHGVGPVMWETRRGVLPTAVPIPSVMIPSETEIDFENLPYFAIFREWTPAQLYEMTHGTKRDPGWTMPMVYSQLKTVADQVQKQPNATAFQYMPERIEELFKQDMGFWGSDAVPTIDAWDFYFVEKDGGVYRRVFLDWGPLEYGTELPKTPPTRKNMDEKTTGHFLYSSGKRKFANSISEIIHCQFGDCSAVAPFRYHSVRSLGWMLWGVCDLQNRLHCKFNEAVFANLMWFFRTASDSQLKRLKVANFYHMGVIPPDVGIVPASDRYTPDPNLIQMAFGRNRQLMAENSASYTQDFTRGETGKEMTATETMARLNSVNALASAMISLAYTYEEFKDREICRRLCIKGNPDPLARQFRKLCAEDKVPPEYLDVDRWDISRQRALGGGNKTLEMAEVQFLQTIRKNLGPDAQRRVDHISIESATDSAALAEELAPIEGEKAVSASVVHAQEATERLMRGLKFTAPKDAVAEDYVHVWLNDMADMIGKSVQSGAMASAQEITGWQNMAAHVEEFLKEMETNDDEKEKVRQYQDVLKGLMNQVKAFQQRLVQQMKAQQQGGNGGADAELMGKLRARQIESQAKAANARESHAARTAQKQVAFELEQQRADRQTDAEIRREDLKAQFEANRERMRTLSE